MAARYVIQPPRITDDEEDVSGESTAVNDTNNVESAVGFVAPVDSHNADTELANGRASAYDELVGFKKPADQNLKVWDDPFQN